MQNKIEILDEKILSDKKYRLKEVHFTVNNGEKQQKEVYMRPDCVSVLLYNKEHQTVVLTRQLRLPTYLNGNNDGMLTECCAGVIDQGETPVQCVLRECMEETGYQLDQVDKIAEAYTSPASVEEKIHLFLAPYHAGMKTGKGGGLAEENEHIEILEMPFTEAFAMIGNGNIRDAKTFILLQHLKLSGLMDS